MKICTRCNLKKIKSEFAKRTRNKDGLSCWCKNCVSDHGKIKYLENQEKRKEKTRQWRLNNPEKAKEYKLKYNIEKSGDNKIRDKAYKIKHKDRIREYNKIRFKEKRLTDIEFKIKSALRSRTSKAIKSKNGTKSYKTMDLIGCSILKLKEHLESQFVDGMSWDNYSHQGWNIDHIKPCASFDLTDVEEQKKCFHYTNLQPLWAVDNYKKGKKLNYGDTK